MMSRNNLWLVTLLAICGTAAYVTAQQGVSRGQKTMANSTPVAIASDQSAVAISAASLPLPSGASTAAKQPALGTAGSASADVITVQGIASMTPLKVDGSGFTQPVSGTVAATQSGNWTSRIVGNAGGIFDIAPGSTAPANIIEVGGVFNTSPATLSNGQAGAFQLDSGQNLLTKINAALPAGGNTIGAVTQAGGPWTQNITQFGGSNIATGTGAGGAGIPRVTVSNDSQVRILGNAGAIVDGATGAAPPANVLYFGGLQSGATGGHLGGVTVCDLDKSVNISTATTTSLITGVSGRQVRICAISLVAGGADNVALIEGTTSSTPCDTGAAGLTGGTSAASGFNFGANGGIAQGSGLGEIITTATTGDTVCAVTSAAVQLSGHIKYTIF